MIPQNLRIKFDNLLAEAKWAFHAGDFPKAYDLALRLEDLVLVTQERSRHPQLPVDPTENGVPV